MTRPNPNRRGGPQTAAGKLVASENSLKTGAYALTTLILPGEDQEAFQELKEQFFRDFAPRDIAESAMVRDLAGITWKKMRLDRLENSAIITEMKRPFVKEEFPVGSTITAALANHWLAFKKSPEAYQSAAEAAKEHLAKARPLEATALAPVIKAHPLLREALPHIVLSLEDPWRADTAQQLKGLTRRPEEFKAEYARLTRVGLEGFQGLVAELKAIAANPTALETQLQQMKEARLLKFLESRNGRRVQDDLDRSFYRTLGELRRHQSWRRQQSEITVEPD